MSTGRKRARALVAVLAALAVASSTVVALALPPSADAADEYPTWSEVEAAKASEAAAAAEAQRIEGLLDGLQTEAAALGDEAVRRSADAARSQSDADQAASSLAALQAEATAAQERAAAATRQAG